MTTLCNANGTIYRTISREEICEHKPYYENGFIYPAIYSILVAISFIIPMITILIRIIETIIHSFNNSIPMKENKNEKDFDFQQLE